MLSSSHGSTSTSGGTSEITIKDFLFCQHGREVCSGTEDANGLDSKTTASTLSHDPVDYRADNDFGAGFDEIQGRQGLEAAFKLNKADEAVCLKHGTPTCDNCFNFKKTLAKLEKETKKHKKKGSK